MSQCLASSLENDIRRHANGGEKVVFAQRTHLAEIYPDAEFRDFEQEEMDECLEVSRQTQCSYCFLQGMVNLHDEPGAKKRKSGSGGGFKADGVTPRVVPCSWIEDKAAAKKAAQTKYMEATVGTRVDKDVEAIWTNFDKPEGSMNRWINKLARAAKVAGATSQCSSTGCGMAATEEVDAEKLKRHTPRNTKNPRINCESPSSRCVACHGICARCAGLAKGIMSSCGGCGGWWLARGGCWWLAAEAVVRRISTQCSRSPHLRSWFVVRLLA